MVFSGVGNAKALARKALSMMIIFIVEVTGQIQEVLVRRMVGNPAFCIEFAGGKLGSSGHQNAETPIDCRIARPYDCKMVAQPSE